MNPLVSVVIPCHNAVRFLEKTVESVLKQTHSNLECILVDDGSTDHTAEMCKSLVARDERVKYIHKENGGIASARNAGIKAAKGDWVQLLDHDDWLAHDKFRVQLEFLDSKNLERHDNVILHHDFQVVRQDEKLETTSTTDIVSENFTNEELLNRIFSWSFKPDLPIHTSTLLYHRDVFKRKMYRETKEPIFEDFDLYVHLLLTDVSMVYTPFLGSYYRVHPTATSSRREYNRESYIGFLELAYESNKELLRSNPNIETLIKEALWRRDIKRFNRLIRINQDPVRFKFILTKNERLMKSIYWLRGFSKRSNEAVKSGAQSVFLFTLIQNFPDSYSRIFDRSVGNFVQNRDEDSFQTADMCFQPLHSAYQFIEVCHFL